MKTRKFTFYRPVSVKSRHVLHDATYEVVKDMDFLEATSATDLHMTLLSNRMLRKNTAPARFVPHYIAFDANRKNFATDTTTAWESTEIATKEVKATKYILGLFLELPEWLCRERNSVRRTSNISEEDIAFKNSEYNPHITLAEFIGSIVDAEGLYEAESRLRSSLSGLDIVTLDPLCLSSSEQSWVFQPRQKPVNNMTVNA